MRDRKNTNLSISSLSQSSPPASTASRGSLNEKRCSSPPPTPSLPWPVTKENKLKSSSAWTLAIRSAATLFVMMVLWRVLVCWPATMSLFRHLTVSEYHCNGIEPVGDNALPQEPTALVVSTPAGHSRWTISIPANSSFPLRSKQYHNICVQGEGLRESLLLESRLLRAKDWRRKHRYYTVDSTFLDVAEAEEFGTLPKANTGDGICETSLTFSMDTDDASFGKTLLMLWLSYGLAKKEGRSFFLDDTRWPYGSYTSYFTPPPDQACSPPPPSHIIPCPHSAKHILVSAATARWTFGSAFDGEFVSSRKGAIERSRLVHDLLRTGYEDLFHLLGEDANYASVRGTELKEDGVRHGEPILGMHVRRGDLHPVEYEFAGDYLPLERFTEAAQSMRSRLRYELNDTETRPTLLAASDDPKIYASSELLLAASRFTVAKAQERIQLADKALLAQSLPTQVGSYVKHVDENSGWEGGFYSRLFYSLGKDARQSGGVTIQGPLGVAAKKGDVEVIPEQVLRMRELVGRAYLLDLSILGQGDGVVCAVSSASCRVLGVMLGWSAVKEGRWTNVDDGRPWSWDGRR